MSRLRKDETITPKNMARNKMLALALYDYMNDPNESNLHQHQPQLISFRRGTILDVFQSNGGWSYGRVVQRLIDEDASTNLNALSTGWFPSNYVSLYESPSSATSLPLDNTVIKLSNSNDSTIIASDQTERSEDDDGFCSTPMGGYIEPDEVNDPNNTTRNTATNEDRYIEILPPGVATVPVPTRRQLRVVTMPKNLVNNIATTTSKITNRLHRRQNHPSTTTSPAVYISP